MPRCKRCNLDHFNFQSCETAQAEADLARRRDASPRQILRSRETTVEGERDWKDQHHTMVAVGNRSVYPRTQHPAYEAPVKPVVEARDLSYPKFFEE